MISTRDIKRKIKTIQSIQQMCRAMKTVSLVKLQKAEARLVSARPYMAGMGRCLARLMGAVGGKLLPRGGEKAVAVITSDKGLCGGYNSNVIRRAQQEIDDAPLVTMGRKGARFFRRQKNPILESMVPLGSEPTFGQIAPFADKLTERLKNGEMAGLRAVYGRFLRGTRSEITAEEIFPPEELEAIEEEIILEPAAPQMAEHLLGRYMRARLYAVALESSASEHGARVAAMTAASENAEEMIDELTMDYNKARQATITKELSEIVGSAEALR